MYRPLTQAQIDQLYIRTSGSTEGFVTEYYNLISMYSKHGVTKKLLATLKTPPTPERGIGRLHVYHRRLYDRGLLIQSLPSKPLNTKGLL